MYVIHYTIRMCKCVYAVIYRHRQLIRLITDDTKRLEAVNYQLTAQISFYRSKLENLSWAEKNSTRKFDSHKPVKTAIKARESNELAQLKRTLSD